MKKSVFLLQKWGKLLFSCSFLSSFWPKTPCGKRFGVKKGQFLTLFWSPSGSKSVNFDTFGGPFFDQKPRVFGGPKSPGVRFFGQKTPEAKIGLYLRGIWSFLGPILDPFWLLAKKGPNLAPFWPKTPTVAPFWVFWG